MDATVQEYLAAVKLFFWWAAREGLYPDAAAGLRSSRLTGHSLRHTAATLNLLYGGSVEETMQLLGHSNVNTTLIYSHALERAANNSEERIAKAILGYGGIFNIDMVLCMCIHIHNFREAVP